MDFLECYPKPRAPLTFKVVVLVGVMEWGQLLISEGIEFLQSVLCLFNENFWDVLSHY